MPTVPPADADVVGVGLGGGEFGVCDGVGVGGVGVGGIDTTVVGGGEVRGCDFGVCDGVDVGVGVWVLWLVVTPPFAGGGNGTTGFPTSAAFIADCQISAGNVPPKTSPTPPAATVLLRS